MSIIEGLREHNYLVSNFRLVACDLQFHEKLLSSIFFLTIFAFHFGEIMHARKNSAFLHVLFLENKTQISKKKKILDNVFDQIAGHMQKFGQIEEKSKNGLTCDSYALNPLIYCVLPENA